MVHRSLLHDLSVLARWYDRGGAILAALDRSLRSVVECVLYTSPPALIPLCPQHYITEGSDAGNVRSAPGRRPPRARPVSIPRRLACRRHQRSRDSGRDPVVLQQPLLSAAALSFRRKLRPLFVASPSDRLVPRAPLHRGSLAQRRGELPCGSCYRTQRESQVISRSSISAFGLKGWTKTALRRRNSVLHRLRERTPGVRGHAGRPASSTTDRPPSLLAVRRPRSLHLLFHARMPK